MVLIEIDLNFMISPLKRVILQFATLNDQRVYTPLSDRPKTDALVHLARMTLANNRLLNFTSNLPEKLQYGKTLKK